MTLGTARSLSASPEAEVQFPFTRCVNADPSPSMHQHDRIASNNTEWDKLRAITLKAKNGKAFQPSDAEEHSAPKQRGWHIVTTVGGRPN